MTVRLDPATIKMLLEIPWFSACGQAADIPGAMAVKNAKEAKKTIASTRWENLVLDQRGDFTTALCLRSVRGEGSEYNSWNDLVIAFKENHLPALETLWQERLEPLDLWEKEVQNDVSFNIIAIAVLDAYKEILELPPFFRQLLAIYWQGHLACGWKGKKDKGCYLVY